MTAPIAWALLLLFAAHLAGFSVLAARRREGYYLALVVTFTLLTASFALYLAVPGRDLGGIKLFQLTRYLAWASAALSLSWTLRRIAARLRR